MTGLLGTPDLLSVDYYGERLVTVPAGMRIPDDVQPQPKERLGRLFERLIGYGISSLNPVRHHSRVQIIQEKETIGELDMVFELEGEAVTHHWELAIKYYLQVGERFVGLKRRDRLDLKLQKLFDQQLRLSEHRVTRERLATLGYPTQIQSQVLVKGMLFYPWGTEPRFPPEVSPDHARGAWSVGFPASYQVASTAWVLLPKLAWHVPFCATEPEGVVSGEEAARLSVGQGDLMWARIERDNDVWRERERLCVVGPQFVE